MGDLIQFPKLYRPPEEDQIARLRRIKAAIERINNLMTELRKEQDERNKTRPGESGPIPDPKGSD